MKIKKFRPCHSAVGFSLSCDLGGPVSSPGFFMWHSCWT